MKKLNAIKLIAAYALFYWAGGTIYAQTIDSRQDLAAKIAALQQGPEMDRMLQQLAGSATQQLMTADLNARIGKMPGDKRQAAAGAIDGELKSFNEDTLRIIKMQSSKVASDKLTAAYAEKFSEEELKQLLTMMQAPVFKKYQTTSPELGSIFVRGLIEATRADVERRGKQFDAAVSKIVGATPAPRAPAAPANPAAAASASKKP